MADEKHCLYCCFPQARWPGPDHHGRRGAGCQQEGSGRPSLAGLGPMLRTSSSTQRPHSSDSSEKEGGAEEAAAGTTAEGEDGGKKEKKKKKKKHKKHGSDSEVSALHPLGRFVA